MGRWLAGLAGLLLALAPMPVQAESVVARVDLSAQTMEVSVEGEPLYRWPISSARRGYVTPTGSYRPERLYRRYFSRRYDNAPMPYAIFFRAGYAIHGTEHLRQLGRPASHGCIRLAPGNAAQLFGLVQRYGSRETRIIIAH